MKISKEIHSFLSDLQFKFVDLEKRFQFVEKIFRKPFSHLALE